MSLETIRLDTLDLRPGHTLLDLGCGEGRHAISAFLQHEVHVVGVDLNDADLRTAHQRLLEFTDSPSTDQKSCRFLRASGLALPFGDDTFDRVICAEVLEHVPAFEAMLSEIERVLKPDGKLAVSVPRYLPEWVCWQLSDAYHEVPGGHVRIFRSRQLRDSIEGLGLKRFARHWAHSLHVPYWWLRCLFWSTEHDGSEVAIVKAYHRFLVWDLMQRPWLTRVLDAVLNPLLGKSVVMYFSRRRS